MSAFFRSALLLIPSCCMSIISHAQNVFADPADTTATKKLKSSNTKVAPAGPKPIRNELSFGYRLHTAGWSMYFDIGKVKPENARTADMFYKVNVWQLEFSEKKHPKQEKLTAEGNASGGSANYVYGKINNFYALKLGYGKRFMLAGKPDPGSVSIHWTNMLSASLGLLKPYYLNVDSDPNAVKYSDNPNVFLTQRNILGAAGFGQGLSEVKTIPGGHFKSMLHFDFAANRKSVLAVETGVSVDYYSEPIPIMVDQEAKPYFVDLFVAFQFGKRW